jgi:xanthine dehydrogenase YagS FAD-binding subunit
VEAVLTGKAASQDLIDRAAAVAVEGARPRRDNGFKVELLRGAVAKALRTLLHRHPKGGRA